MDQEFHTHAISSNIHPKWIYKAPNRAPMNTVQLLQHRSRTGCQIRRLNLDITDTLLQYDWPGPHPETEDYQPPNRLEGLTPSLEYVIRVSIERAPDPCPGQMVANFYRLSDLNRDRPIEFSSHVIFKKLRFDGGYSVRVTQTWHKNIFDISATNHQNNRKYSTVIVAPDADMYGYVIAFNHWG